MAFSFENLKVYQDSLTCVEEVQNLLKRLGKHCPPVIRNQLSRAALSIPLNIAEGNGRWHKREKRQYYYIARGSAFEVVSIIQVMERMGILKKETMKALYNSLVEICKMLSGLIRSVEDLNRKSEALHQAEDLF